jgi:hypothetical protein
LKGLKRRFIEEEAVRSDDEEGREGKRAREGGGEGGREGGESLWAWTYLFFFLSLGTPGWGGGGGEGGGRGGGGMFVAGFEDISDDDAR